MRFGLFDLAWGSCVVMDERLDRESSRGGREMADFEEGRQLEEVVVQGFGDPLDSFLIGSKVVGGREGTRRVSSTR